MCWGSFFKIVSVCDSAVEGVFWVSEPGKYRPAACDVDEDCPQITWYADELRNYECRSGLCQNVDLDVYQPDILYRTDVMTLCYAMHPRLDTASWTYPLVTEIDATIAQACPDRETPCASPAGCWQP